MQRCRHRKEQKKHTKREIAQKKNVCKIQFLNSCINFVSLLTKEPSKEIQDEFDKEHEDILTVGNNIWLCDARVDLDDLNEKMEADFPNEEFDSLGGFVFDIFGKVPVKYEKASWKNYDFIVQDMEGHRINVIKVIKKETEDTDEKTSHIGYGLAADQVREIFPELVVEDEYGNPCINYVEMVPLLVQTIKDLNARIDKLEGIDSKPTKAKTTNIETLSSEDICNLSQNTPNPFTTSTTIKMNIPSSVRNATLRIYDMTGKQVRSIMIEERGAVSISLSSESLYSGMYIYTLIADGNVINSRKMIME